MWKRWNLDTWGTALKCWLGTTVICFTKLFLTNPSTESSSRLPVISSLPFPARGTWEQSKSNLLTCLFKTFYYLRCWFAVAFSYICLTLAVNALGRNAISVSFTVFIELHVWYSPEQIIIMIATARSAGLTSQNGKSQLPFFLKILD